MDGSGPDARGSAPPIEEGPIHDVPARRLRPGGGPRRLDTGGSSTRRDVARGAAGADARSGLGARRAPPSVRHSRSRATDHDDSREAAPHLASDRRPHVMDAARCCVGVQSSIRADDQKPSGRTRSSSSERQASAFPGAACSTSLAGSMVEMPVTPILIEFKEGESSGDCSYPVAADTPLIIAPYREADGRLHADLGDAAGRPVIGAGAEVHRRGDGAVRSGRRSTAGSGGAANSRRWVHARRSATSSWRSPLSRCSCWGRWRCSDASGAVLPDRIVRPARERVRALA